MILYGSSLSPYVRKVLAFTGEKGIELELQPTGFPNHSPDYLEASPFRKMPALRDDDYTLADSSAIVHYLEAKHPEPPLIPADPKLRGQDDLVRGVRRYDPRRLRSEDLLQPHRRAAVHGPAG
jgi:glutathione S-transferase